MNATKQTLGKILGQPLRLVAPVFQRPYVWVEEENWLPLWEAVLEVAERRLNEERARAHFLGALVLDQIRTHTGEVETRQVIDGQQRMTTLQLMLAAIRDTCVADAEGYREPWAQLTHNQIVFGDSGEETFKVWPTIVDREHFRRSMTAGSPAALQAMYTAGDFTDEAEHRIPQAYFFFATKARHWLGSPSDPEFGMRMRALLSAIRNDLHLVVIDLEADDDAQLIFQTMNALGAPLLPGDLIKNYLFHVAETHGLDAEKLHKEYWTPLDSESLFWRADVLQGRLKRPRIDVFFQHFLTLRMREDVGATHIFPTYRRYAESRPQITPAEHLADIRTYTRIYKQFEDFPRQSREGMFFYRLDQLDTSTVLPLLLEVFRHLSRPEFRSARDQVLDDLESFLIRRTVCNLTTKHYNRFFLDIVQSLTDDPMLIAPTIRSHLLRSDADTVRWPTDDEFRTELVLASLYSRIVRRRLRMLLEAVEVAMRSELSEELSIPTDLTIEHILPQSWQEHWPLPGERDEVEELKTRTSLLHTLGNLTLVTKKLNPSVSNAGWATKREAFFEHSGLAMNRALYKLPRWTEETIIIRAGHMAEISIRLWPRPEKPDSSNAETSVL